MNKILSTSIMFLATLTLAGCSNENDPDAPIDPADAVELGVTAGVSLTKSAIQGGDGDAGKQNGSASTVMQNVAIRATGSDYTSTKKNDKAIYNQSGGTWTSEVADKIMLTSSIATIYAFHPAYLFDANGNKTATAIALPERLLRMVMPPFRYPFSKVARGLPDHLPRRRTVRLQMPITLVVLQFFPLPVKRIICGRAVRQDRLQVMEKQMPT